MAMMTTRTTMPETLTWVPTGVTIVMCEHVYPFGLTGREYWRRKWATEDAWDDLDDRQRRRELQAEADAIEVAAALELGYLDLGGEG